MLVTSEKKNKFLFYVTLTCNIVNSFLLAFIVLTISVLFTTFQNIIGYYQDKMSIMETNMQHTRALFNSCKNSLDNTLQELNTTNQQLDKCNTVINKIKAIVNEEGTGTTTEMNIEK